MKGGKRKLHLFLLACFGCWLLQSGFVAPLLAHSAPAGKDHYRGQARFRVFTSAQGLSRSTVWSIVRDKTGFVYFATWSGFDRFDGQSFRSHKRDPKHEGLVDNQTRVLYADDSDRIWIGTNSGLSLYDPATGQIQAMAALNARLPHLSVMALTGKGALLWIGTRQGLVRYDHESKEIRTYDHLNPQGLHHLSVRSLQIDAFGKCWVGTENGLFRQKGDKFEVLGLGPAEDQRLLNGFIRAIWFDSKGSAWLGTEKGMDCFDPKTNRIRHFVPDKTNPSGLQDGWINVIVGEADDTLWIGGREGGLTRYDPEQDHFLHFRKQLDDPMSLPANDIVTLMLDREGLLWVGTFLGGVGVLDLNPVRFCGLTKRSAPNQKIKEAQVLAEGDDGLLWIGTQSGLLRLDPETEESKFFTADLASREGLSDNQVLALLPERDGALWVGTYSGGMNRYDPKSETFEHFMMPEDRPDSVYHSMILTLYRDRKGQIWTGTKGSAFIFDPESKSFMRQPDLLKDSNNQALMNIWSFCETDSETIWMGTTSQGVFKKSPDGLEQFHANQGAGSLSHNTVNAMTIDDKGRLWLGTGNGLNLYLPESKSFRSFFSDDGLPSNHISGLIARDDSVWVSTNRGLAQLRYEANELQVRNFSIRDGLLVDDFFRAATLIRKNGDLAFGGNGGVAVYNDNFVENQTPSPQVAITGFRVFDNELKLPQSITHTKKIVLSHSQNVFAFEIAVLDYRSALNDKLAYRLLGFDSDWIYSHGRRFISYSNLPGGDYKLELATASEDRRLVASKTLDLVIIPPFWARWWFRLFVLVSMGTIVFLLHKKRERMLDAKTRNLENMVQEKTLELENSKQRLLEVAHHAGIFEIASGVLNQIGEQLNNLKFRVRIIQSELENSAQPILQENEARLQRVLDPNSGTARERAETAAAVMVEMDVFAEKFGGERQRIQEAAEDLERRVELIKDTISVQHSYAKTPFYTQEVDMAGLVRDALRLEHGSLMELGVEVGAVLPDGIKVYVTRVKVMNVLTQVIKNAVEAMAESPAPRRLELRYQREVNGPHLIQIRDTGSGIEPGDMTKVFHANFSTKADRSGLGLHEAINSMIELGGWLKLESEGPGKGALATIAIPVEPPKMDGKG